MLHRAHWGSNPDRLPFSQPLPEWLSGLSVAGKVAVPVAGLGRAAASAGARSVTGRPREDRHDFRCRPSLAEQGDHEAHGTGHVVEESLITVTEVVKASFPIGSGDE